MVTTITVRTSQNSQNVFLCDVVMCVCSFLLIYQCTRRYIPEDLNVAMRTLTQKDLLVSGYCFKLVRDVF